jgi:hypothetical protein
MTKTRNKNLQRFITHNSFLIFILQASNNKSVFPQLTQFRSKKSPPHSSFFADFSSKDEAWRTRRVRAANAYRPSNPVAQKLV